MDDRSRSGVVLCGVDAEEGEAEVVAVARRLAAALGERLVLVHVAEPPVGPPASIADAAGVVPPAAPGGVSPEAADRALERLARDAGGEEVETRMLAGLASDEIVAEAEAEGASLVVVGSRRRGPRSGAVLGSVSGDVLARAGCPVVVVPREVAARVEPGEATVVCGVETSPAGWGAARLAGEVGAALRARLLLAHVVPTSARGAAAAVEPEPGEEPYAAAQRRAGAGVLEAVARHYGLDGHAEFRVAPGPVVEALIDLIEREEADLLVVGGEGRGAARRAVVGDTALELIEAAPCPVMVVPGEDDPTGGDAIRSVGS